MKWVVHIGTEKTGSKAIQKFLLCHSADSLNPKLCFPKSGREGLWHEPIYEELIAGKNAMLKMAAEEATKSSAELNVISYEGLNVLSVPQIISIQKVIGPATIVLFIRRQDQFVNSYYNQLIKAHRVDIDYIEKFEESINDYNIDYDHMQTIRRWAEVFGEKNIIPIIYNKQISSVKQFLNHIGISEDFNDCENGDNNPNPALNLEAMKILKYVKKINRHTQVQLPQLVNAAHKILRESFVDTYRIGDQYLLPFYQRNLIFSHYKESNEEVRRCFFPDMPYLFPPLTQCEIDHEIVHVNKGIIQRIFMEVNVTISEKILTECCI